MRWNSARSSGRSTSSTTRAPVASAGGTWRSVSARPARNRAPASAPQMAARWLLPDPSGPTSATTRAGQSGQLSMSVSAASLDGPGRKSSRPKLSACGSASASWRGGLGIASGGLRAGVESALAILPEREAVEHTERRGERNRQQQPDESEQVAEREQGKHHPDGVQPHAFPDELRRQYIAFEKLTGEENADD